MFFSVARRNALTTATMKTKTLAKLHFLFSQLDCDLEIGLAYAIAETFNTSPAVIFSAYEAWQVA